MLWAAVAYGCGILIGVHAWRPDSWWIAAGCAFYLAAIYLSVHRHRLGWTLALGTLALLGALAIQLRSAGPRFDDSVYLYADRQALTMEGHVIKDGRVQRRGDHEVRETFDLQLNGLQTLDGLTHSTHANIRFSVYGESTGTENVPVFQYGQRLRILGRLRRARNFRNPGAFDYEAYLSDLGISALGTGKLQDVEIVPGFEGNRFAEWKSHVHRAIVGRVHELWAPREAALIDAMVVGEEAFIDRDTRLDFQRSGTYHVLVVSGMNVSILAFVVFWTLRRLRMTEGLATFITVALCGGYAFITDVGAPVWRATLMCAVYLCTRLLYRDRAALNGLGGAGLALMVADPRQLLSASFQMTFLCVLIVAGVCIPVFQRSSQLYKKALLNWDSITYAALLPPRVAQFRLDLQMISQRVASFVGKAWGACLIRGIAGFTLSAFELVFVSAVMQMGLALPMAYYFHRATTLGLPANLIVVPLTELLMPAVLFALSVGFVFPWLAKIPALLSAVAVNGIAGSVHGLAGLRAADLRVPIPGAAMMAIAGIALLYALWSARRNWRLLGGGLSGLLAVAVALAVVRAEPRIHRGVLELTSIDVGEGDSNLIITPAGKTLLVDAGGPIGPDGSQLDFGEDVVSPYLWTRGISRLDIVAITHAHSDHIGGIPSVLKNFRPRELWVGLPAVGAGIENVMATARALGIEVVRHAEGDHIDFGGATIEILFPPVDWPASPKPRNNDSMVMRVSFRNSSILLEGDAEKRVERRIAASEHPRANVLKVGHHGSANATTPDLLDCARPEFAVISVGAGNSFGLPRLQTLASLSGAGTRVYRTDLDGAVTFYLDGDSVTPSLAGLR